MRQPPFFSIVIPTYGRPDAIARCLHSLAELDYPRDRFEVIVVDDGSPAPLDGALTSFESELDLTVYRQAHAGPARARNFGADRARGEYLAFTDDDCAPVTDWLRGIAASASSQPDALVGGRTVNMLTENRYSAASQLLISYLYSYYNDADAVFFTSNNFVVPARTFKEMDGFDCRFRRAGGEDRDFCDRWIHEGRAMTYAPDAVVHHYHALSFARFWTQHFAYGVGAAQFHRARAERRMAPVRVEPASFYVRLVHYPFTQARGWKAISLSGLLLVSQVANALGFLRGKRIRP